MGNLTLCSVYHARSGNECVKMNISVVTHSNFCLLFCVLQLWKQRGSLEFSPSWWPWARLLCVWCLPSAGHPRRCAPTQTLALSSLYKRRSTPLPCCCSPWPPQVCNIYSFPMTSTYVNTVFLGFLLFCFSISNYPPNGLLVYVIHVKLSPTEVVSCTSHLCTPLGSAQRLYFLWNCSSISCKVFPKAPGM